MLEADRKLAWSGVVLGFVVAAEIAISLAIVGPQYQEAKSAAARAAEAAGYQDYPWWQYSGAWIAVFTIVLTFSTAALWYTTRRSVRISERSLTDLERPYLYVTTDGRLHFDASLNETFLFYSVVNHGRTPANIIGVAEFLGPAADCEPDTRTQRLGDHRLRVKPIIGVGKRRKDIKSHVTDGSLTHNATGLEVVIDTPNGEYAFFQILILYQGPFSQNHETLATWYFDTASGRFIEYRSWDHKYNCIK